MSTDHIQFQKSIAEIQAQIKPKTETVKASQNQPTQSFEHILDQIQSKTKVSFSKHAQSRVNERSMQVDMQKLNQAVDKANEKGIKDTLVLMDQAAFIVNVSSRVVITAMNQEEMKDNVFTNIDGAVIS